MPRTYKKKKPSVNYSIEDLQEAVNLVKERKLSQRQAAAKYGIPKSVIQLRISGKVSLENQGAGRPTTLSLAEEHELVECLLARAKFGYPCDRQELLDLVASYVAEHAIPNVFKDGKPGEDWYLGFMRRHPRLSLKKPEHLQSLRQNNTIPEIVYDFYEKLEAVFKDKNLTSPDKACFVFNTDESGFNHDPSRVRAIGQKGQPLVRVSGGSGRESTTVLGCASADGAVLPPFIVFKGAAVQPRWVSEKAYPGTHYAVSKGGWMETPVFLNWFEAIFVHYVTDLRNKKQLPDQEAVLIFDGHASHITLDLCKVAIENKITLVRLPSHLTDKLQPLDKTVFGPVKTAWDIKLVEHGKTQMGQCHQRLSKKEFVEVLGEVWQLAMTPANIKSGFKSTGLFPVDAKQFPESKFNPVDLKNYKKKKEQEKRKALGLQDAEKTHEVQQGELNEQVEPLPGTTPDSIDEVGLQEEPQIIPQPETIISVPGTSSTARMSTDRTPKGQQKSHKIATPASSESLGKSITEIFAETLKSSNKKVKETSTQTPKKKITTRLKPERYGEVLTTKDVMERLEKAEAEKAQKEMKKQERKRIKLEKCKDEPKKKTSKIPNRVKGEKKKEEKKNEEKKKEENQKIQVKKQVKRFLDFSSSSDPDDVSESEIFDAPQSDLESEGPEEVDYITPTEKNVKPGSYVLVNVKGGYRKTTNYKYVCFIQSIHEEADDDDEDCEKILKMRVTGLRLKDKHATTFYLNEKDEFFISKDQIISVLPEPVLTEKDRQILHVFPGTVSVFEQS